MVDPSHRNPEQPTYQFDLAALSLQTGTMLLPASSLYPGTTLDDIHAWFDEGEGGYLWFSPDPPVRFAVGPEAVATLRDAWWKAVREQPTEVIEHRLRYAISLLNVDRPPYVVYESLADPEAWGFDWTLREPFFPSLYSWIDGTVATWGWYGWFRAWIWTLVLLVVGLTPRGRRSVAVRTLTAAGIGSLLSFMVAGASSRLPIHLVHDAVRPRRARHRAVVVLPVGTPTPSEIDRSAAGTPSVRGRPTQGRRRGCHCRRRR